MDVEELGLRVRNALRRAAFDNLMNPISGLPGPRLIEEQLRGLLRRAPGSDWAILRLSLDGFRPFGDVYGFLAGEEVLRFAAHLFGQSVDRLGTPDDFIGHSGGDSFILITTPDQAAPLDRRAVRSLQRERQGALFVPRARTRLPGLPRRRRQRATRSAHDAGSSHHDNADGPFSDIRELTQALG